MLAAYAQAVRILSAFVFQTQAAAMMDDCESSAALARGPMRVRSNMSAKKDILLTPDPRLSQVCEPVTEINADIRKLAKRMLKDMYEADGCGLAAPQIGEMVRMVVIDCDYTDERGSENPYVLINPKIVKADGPMRSFSEGCLSFPGISVDIERPSHVIVHAKNLDGDLMQYEAEGNLLAVCLQHEIDHLDGVTMVDHLPPLKRAQKLQECEQAIEQGARPGETTTD